MSAEYVDRRNGGYYVKGTHIQEGNGPYTILCFRRGFLGRR